MYEELRYTVIEKSDLFAIKTPLDILGFLCFIVICIGLWLHLKEREGVHISK